MKSVSKLVQQCIKTKQDPQISVNQLLSVLDEIIPTQFLSDLNLYQSEVFGFVLGKNMDTEHSILVMKFVDKLYRAAKNNYKQVLVFSGFCSGLHLSRYLQVIDTIESLLFILKFSVYPLHQSTVVQIFETPDYVQQLQQIFFHIQESYSILPSTQVQQIYQSNYNIMFSFAAQNIKQFEFQDSRLLIDYCSNSFLDFIQYKISNFSDLLESKPTMTSLMCYRFGSQFLQYFDSHIQNTLDYMHLAVLFEANILTIYKFFFKTNFNAYLQNNLFLFVFDYIVQQFVDKSERLNMLVEQALQFDIYKGNLLNTMLKYMDQFPENCSCVPNILKYVINLNNVTCCDYAQFFKVWPQYESQFSNLVMELLNLQNQIIYDNLIVFMQSAVQYSCSITIPDHFCIQLILQVKSLYMSLLAELIIILSKCSLINVAKILIQLNSQQYFKNETNLQFIDLVSISIRDIQITDVIRDESSILDAFSYHLLKIMFQLPHLRSLSMFELPSSKLKQKLLVSISDELHRKSHILQISQLLKIIVFQDNSLVQPKELQGIYLYFQDLMDILLPEEVIICVFNNIDNDILLPHFVKRLDVIMKIILIKKQWMSDIVQIFEKQCLSFSQTQLNEIPFNILFQVFYVTNHSQIQLNIASRFSNTTLEQMDQLLVSLQARNAHSIYNKYSQFTCDQIFNGIKLVSDTITLDLEKSNQYSIQIWCSLNCNDFLNNVQVFQILDDNSFAFTFMISNNRSLITYRDVYIEIKDQIFADLSKTQVLFVSVNFSQQGFSMIINGIPTLLYQFYDLISLKQLILFKQINYHNVYLTKRLIPLRHQIFLYKTSPDVTTLLSQKQLNKVKIPNYTLVDSIIPYQISQYFNQTKLSTFERKSYESFSSNLLQLENLDSLQKYIISQIQKDLVISEKLIKLITEQCPEHEIFVDPLFPIVLYLYQFQNKFEKPIFVLETMQELSLLCNYTLDKSIDLKSYELQIQQDFVSLETKQISYLQLLQYIENNNNLDEFDAERVFKYSPKLDFSFYLFQLRQFKSVTESSFNIYFKLLQLALQSGLHQYNETKHQIIIFSVLDEIVQQEQSGLFLKLFLPQILQNNEQFLPLLLMYQNEAVFSSVLYLLLELISLVDQSQLYITINKLISCDIIDIIIFKKLIIDASSNEFKIIQIMMKYDYNCSIFNKLYQYAVTYQNTDQNMLFIIIDYLLNNNIQQVFILQLWNMNIYQLENQYITFQSEQSYEVFFQLIQTCCLVFQQSECTEKQKLQYIQQLNFSILANKDTFNNSNLSVDEAIIDWLNIFLLEKQYNIMYPSLIELLMIKDNDSVQNILMKMIKSISYLLFQDNEVCYMINTINLKCQYNQREFYFSKPQIKFSEELKQQFYQYTMETNIKQIFTLSNFFKLQNTQDFSSRKIPDTILVSNILLQFMEQYSDQQISFDTIMKRIVILLSVSDDPQVFSNILTNIYIMIFSYLDVTTFSINLWYLILQLLLPIQIDDQFATIEQYQSSISSEISFDFLTQDSNNYIIELILSQTMYLIMISISMNIDINEQSLYVIFQYFITLSNSFLMQFCSLQFYLDIVSLICVNCQLRPHHCFTFQLVHLLSLLSIQQYKVDWIKFDKIIDKQYVEPLIYLQLIELEKQKTQSQDSVDKVKLFSKSLVSLTVDQGTKSLYLINLSLLSSLIFLFFAQFQDFDIDYFKLFSKYSRKSQPSIKNQQEIYSFIMQFKGIVNSKYLNSFDHDTQRTIKSIFCNRQQDLIQLCSNYFVKYLHYFLLQEFITGVVVTEQQKCKLLRYLFKQNYQQTVSSNCFYSIQLRKTSISPPDVINYQKQIGFILNNIIDIGYLEIQMQLSNFYEKFSQGFRKAYIQSNMFFNIMIPQICTTMPFAFHDKYMTIRDLLQSPFDPIDGVYHVTFSDFTLENAEGLLILSRKYIVLAPSFRFDHVKKGLFRFQNIDFSLFEDKTYQQQFLNICQLAYNYSEESQNSIYHNKPLFLTQNEITYSEKVRRLQQIEEQTDYHNLIEEKQKISTKYLQFVKFINISDIIICNRFQYSGRASSILLKCNYGFQSVIQFNDEISIPTVQVLVAKRQKYTQLSVQRYIEEYQDDINITPQFIYNAIALREEALLKLYYRFQQEQLQICINEKDFELNYSIPQFKAKTNLDVEYLLYRLVIPSNSYILKLILTKSSSYKNIQYTKHGFNFFKTEETLICDSSLTTYSVYKFEQPTRLQQGFKLLVEKVNKLSMISELKRLGFETEQQIIDKWYDAQISNLQFMQLINYLANRIDITLQNASIFPWVLDTLDSSSQLLENTNNINDSQIEQNVGQLRLFSFPPPAQSVDMRNSLVQKFVETQLFQLATLPSSAASNIYFMVRSLEGERGLRRLQGGVYDVADRLYSDYEKAFTCVTSTQNAKELTSDSISLPDSIINYYGLDFGCLQDGTPVSSLNIQKYSVSQFLLIQQSCMNCTLTTQLLHFWINQMFGCDQKKQDFCNIYPNQTYFGAIDLNSFINDETRLNYEEISNFGQVPIKLFNKPLQMNSIKKSNLIDLLLQYFCKQGIITDFKFQLKSITQISYSMTIENLPPKSSYKLVDLHRIIQFEKITSKFKILQLSTMNIQIVQLDKEFSIPSTKKLIDATIENNLAYLLFEDLTMYISCFSLNVIMNEMNLSQFFLDSNKEMSHFLISIVTELSHIMIQAGNQLLIITQSGFPLLIGNLEYSTAIQFVQVYQFWFFIQSSATQIFVYVMDIFETIQVINEQSVVCGIQTPLKMNCSIIVHPLLRTFKSLVDEVNAGKQWNDVKSWKLASVKLIAQIMVQNLADIKIIENNLMIYIE